jgi:hypothetical protein
VVPSVVADAQEQVRSLAAIARAGSVAGAEERAAWLVGLRQLVDTAEAAFIAVLADFDAAGDGEVLHAATSTQSWLRGALGLASGDAAERVRIARASRDQLSEPLHRVSFDKTRVIARSAHALPPSHHEQAVATLTDIAEHVGVDDLRAAARHLKHVVDPDGSLRQAEVDFDRRWLTLSPMLDGMHSVEGVLDAESAGLLRSALAPSAVPSGPHDLRTAAQRRADGLIEIVAAAVRSEGLPSLSGTTTALQVQVSFDGLARTSPDPAQLVSPTGRVPTWITDRALSRLACDASVRRVVLDPAGVPVELGRQTRLFTGTQRLALATRDGGCRFPGCGRPAKHTDAHHLTSWREGGPTTLSNGMLLCRHHHRQVHEGGWSIQPDRKDVGSNGTVTFVGPRGQRLSSPVPSMRPAVRAGPAE